MPSNIEIKARVAGMAALESRTKQIADGPAVELNQEDVFFPCASGRLKLRTLAADRGELICYDRPDTDAPKQSTYDIFRTSDPHQLKSVLLQALGSTIIVKKRRLLYMVGQTRVHLDWVEGLGTFMELEVVLRPGQSADEGRAVARGLMTQLCINESDLISCAYADLLEAECSVKS